MTDTTHTPEVLLAIEQAKKAIQAKKRAIAAKEASIAAELPSLQMRYPFIKGYAGDVYKDGTPRVEAIHGPRHGTYWQWTCQICGGDKLSAKSDLVTAHKNGTCKECNKAAKKGGVGAAEALLAKYGIDVE